jgi:hypothetical protein
MSCTVCARLCELHQAENPRIGLTEQERERLLAELVKASADAGISDDELDNAIDAFQLMRNYVSLFTLWRTERLSVGWSVESQDLTWTAADLETLEESIR